MTIFASKIRIMKKLKTMMLALAMTAGASAEQPKPKDKWKSENVSYNEFGGKTL